jgi:hypothetical protein
MDIVLPSVPNFVPTDLKIYRIIKKYGIINSEKLFCAVRSISKMFITTPKIIILEVLKNEPRQSELRKENDIHKNSLFEILQIETLLKNDDILNAVDWAKFKFYVEAARLFIYKDEPMAIKHSENLDHSWNEIKYTGNTEWVNKKSWKEVKTLINDILRKSSFLIVAGQELLDINQHNDCETWKLMIYPKIFEKRDKILQTLKQQNNLIRERNRGKDKPLLLLKDVVRYFLIKLSKYYEKLSKLGDKTTKKELEEYRLFNHQIPLEFAGMLRVSEASYSPKYKSKKRFIKLEQKLNIYFKIYNADINCDIDEELEIQKKENKTRKDKSRERKLDSELFLIENELESGGKPSKRMRLTKTKKRF